ncbi:MAG: filamentous hemagglutinin N-terminal domain-containing protein [Desulfamplus sp.]|nr:filamentous hemagglutinin N-terminal domain-containing protein [Desulfamplus sp.]
MNPKQLIINLFLFLFCFTSPTLLHADISTDGSLGAAQSLTGPDYAIPETLGTLKGNNLFHSFEKFSIKTEESATFTGSDSIQNIISRVTGGETSNIDGTLRSNIGTADFYFINPSGVIFGQNAKVDVPAAFHVSTGNELKFADGASFKASKSEQSTLTQAAPEAFGFLGTQSASIEINGKDIEINGSMLSFAPESKVSLTSSKDITIKGAKIGTEEKQAILVNEGGEIELTAKGDLLMENAIIYVSGNGGGNVAVKAVNAKSIGTTIAADNTGDNNADKGVDIAVDNKLEVLDGSVISSSTWSKGDSGSVSIKAGEMKIDGQANRDITGVISNALTDSEGNAGQVILSIKGLLELLNGGVILSDTRAKGNAGRVTINVDQMTIDRQGNDLQFTGVASRARAANSEGKAGTVTITAAGLLQILNGAAISSSTWSKGDAGDVKVNAGDMKIDGQDSSYFNGIASNTSTTNSEGKAGTIEITVSGLLEILNGSEIISSTWSKGDAGNIKINAKNMKIDGQGNFFQLTGVLSTAESTDSEGKAGTVEITVTGLLEILNEATISSSTWSKGDAGNIKINAGNIKIDGLNHIYFTGVGGNIAPDSTGYAGNILINADSITLLNNAQISIAAYQTLPKEKLANMPKNSITLNTTQLKIESGSSISSSSKNNGNTRASDIEINAAMIYLHDGQITTSVSDRGGKDGGNISINKDTAPTNFLVMQTGFIQASTDAEDASGGIIVINADALLQESDATLEIGGDNKIKRFEMESNRNIIQASAPECAL